LLSSSDKAASPPGTRSNEALTYQAVCLYDSYQL
jgi:hypothetical protein